MFRHIPGDGLPPGRPLHPLQLPPDRCCPQLSCWGFEALLSSPLAFLRKNTSSTKLEDEEVRKRSFSRSVLICSCFYQVFLTVHCKHAITNYICPECVMVGFHTITESCFMITAQQFSKEAEMEVSAHRRRFSKTLWLLFFRRSTNASSAPLTLGLKLPPFFWKWKYGGFCFRSESDSESQDENAKLLVHGLASVLDSLLK